MAGHREQVWLHASERKALIEFCRGAQLSRSGVIRRALLVFLGGVESSELLRRCRLERELDLLFEEEKRLRRVQSKILSDFVYLRAYARQVMVGGWEDGGKFRPPIAHAPNATLAIQALEGVFSNRSRIGQRIAEISLELYPGVYGLAMLPSSDQAEGIQRKREWTDEMQKR